MTDELPEEERPTILIVDDEPLNRTILAELLHEDHRVLLAKDGPSALRRVASEPEVRLILLDVSMPGMDGYEVLRRLRGDPSTSGIPVIFITGQTDEADEERGLLIGAADYVTKPIRPAIVRARVRNHLRFAAHRRALLRLSRLDGLTGIANRRHFDEEFDRACRRVARGSSSLGIAIFDVDHFKEFNDHYGHAAGDEVLRKIAGSLQRYARRPYDLAARYGGEEFVLLIPDGEGFGSRMEEVRLAIRNLAIPHARSRTSATVTVSGGGVVAPAGIEIAPDALLEMADRALYRSKHSGRDRVLVRWIHRDGSG